MPLGVAITPDGNTLAIGFHGGALVGWDCAAGRAIFGVRSGPAERGYVNAVAVTKDGQKFVAGVPGGVRFDRTGQLLHQLAGTDSVSGSLVPTTAVWPRPPADPPVGCCQRRNPGAC
jgi:hypothetical protein